MSNSNRVSSLFPKEVSQKGQARWSKRTRSGNRSLVVFWHSFLWADIDHLRALALQRIKQFGNRMATMLGEGNGETFVNWL